MENEGETITMGFIGYSMGLKPRCCVYGFFHKVMYIKELRIQDWGLGIRISDVYYRVKGLGFGV